jgi:signal transduction histidine kinase
VWRTQDKFGSRERLCVAVRGTRDDLEERMRELSLLLKVSHKVASILEIRPLLSTILAQLKTVVDYTGAAILRFQEDQLVLLDYQGPLARAQIERMLRLFDQSSTFALMRERREAVLRSDLHLDTRFTSAYFKEAHAGAQHAETVFRQFRAWMAVPLVVQERTIGVLTLHHRRSHFYTPHHASLAFALANSAAVALENAYLHEQALALAVVQERQHLSRELHDTVSQAFYGICLSAHSALEALCSDPGEARASLEHVLVYSEVGLAEIRALLLELRPDLLEAEGLVVALQKQVMTLQKRHCLPVEVLLEAEPAIPLESKHALLRVAQEALHNVVKHAQAARVTLRLTSDCRQLVLAISDDGRGFDSSAAFPGHLGLRSMHERVARLDGALSIESVPGAGTTVIARVPLRRRNL